MIKTMKIGLLVSVFCLTTAAQAYANAVYSAPPSGCSGNPGLSQAYLWTGTGYSGTCYSLQMDGSSNPWTSWDATTGFPNDVIQSVKVGSLVTLAMFWNSFTSQDNGSTYSVAPSTWISDLGTWKNQVSAARLQSFSNCNITEAVVLFTDANYGGDCNVYVPYSSCYRDPVAMAFRNDTVSSAQYNGGSSAATLYENSAFSGSEYDLWSGTQVSNLGSFNDVVSSMGILNGQCWRQ
jgi:hypothetical protein